jgi:hypothetical protein
MLKKDGLKGSVEAVSTDILRCGDCLHHRSHAHAEKKTVCEREGVLPVAIAPLECFTPNASLLTGNVDQLTQLLSIFATYDLKQRRALIELLKQEDIGETFYFRIGEDFISNYLRGIVVGRTSSGEIMLIGSPSEKTAGSAFVSYLMDAEGLLNHAEWEAKRADLFDKNRVIDPDNTTIKRTTVTDNYIPPTIDMSPEMLEAAASEKKKKKRKDEDADDSGDE